MCELSKSNTKKFPFIFFENFDAVKVSGQFDWLADTNDCVSAGSIRYENDLDC